MCTASLTYLKAPYTKSSFSLVLNNTCPQCIYKPTKHEKDHPFISFLPTSITKCVSEWVVQVSSLLWCHKIIRTAPLGGSSSSGYISATHWTEEMWKQVCLGPSSLKKIVWSATDQFNLKTRKQPFEDRDQACYNYSRVNDLCCILSWKLICTFWRHGGL